MADDEGTLALFQLHGVDTDLGTVGRCEANLRTAIEASQLEALDAAAVGAALVGARALDRAEHASKPYYAVAALLSPYRELLEGLGLAKTPGVLVPDKPNSGADAVESWLAGISAPTPGTG